MRIPAVGSAQSSTAFGLFLNQRRYGVTVAVIWELALVKPEGDVICKRVVPAFNGLKEVVCEFGLSAPWNTTGFVVMLPTGLVPDWSVKVMVAAVPVRPGRTSWVAVGVRYMGSSMEGTTVSVVGLSPTAVVKLAVDWNPKPPGFMVTGPLAEA